MSDELIISLGRWSWPEHLKKESSYFCHMHNLDKFCLNKGWKTKMGFEAWDMRDPFCNKKYSKDSYMLTSWHHDPDRVNSQPRYILIWANVTPTLIRLPNGNIYQPKCYDVIIFDNTVCEHKMPNVIGSERYFVRGWDMCRIEER